MAKAARPGVNTISRPMTPKPYNDPMVTSANSKREAQAHRALVSRSCQAAGTKPDPMFPGRTVCAFCGANHG